MKGTAKVRRSLGWAGVVVAWASAGLGLLAPGLGGEGPGLPGAIGFAAETIVAVAVPGGLVVLGLATFLAVRRRRVRAVLVLVAALGLLAPELVPLASGPTRTRVLGEVSLRVAAINLQGDNEDDPAMAGALEELDADVLVLCEFSRSWEERLAALAATYPHRIVAAAPGLTGMDAKALRIGVWSRLLPAGEPEVRYLGGINAQIRVRLRAGDRTFAMYAVHPWKPFGWRSYARAFRERSELLAWLAAETLPAIVAGDFNAPPRSAFVRRLEEGGWIDAGTAVEVRAAGSWPMHPAVLAPFRIAIDHVMCRGGWVPVGYRRGRATASDHAAVGAEVAWRPG